MEKSLIIKKYELADKATLLSVFESNTPLYFHPNELILFSDYLELFRETYFTLREEESVIGGLGYVISADQFTADITWIFVRPEKQRSGYGKKAVNYLLTKLKSILSLKKIKVRTSQHGNLFFESFGFKRIHFEKDYWAAGLDLYEMEINLW